MSERVQQRIGPHRSLSLPAVGRHTHGAVLMEIIMYFSHSKNPRPSQNNDYRPVALTSLVMNYLERLLLRRISTRKRHRVKILISLPTGETGVPKMQFSHLFTMLRNTWIHPKLQPVFSSWTFQVRSTLSSHIYYSRN